MDKVVWWNRPIEGRGEKPTTPKPTLANVVTRQVILPAEVGRKPESDAVPQRSAPPVPEPR